MDRFQNILVYVNSDAHEQPALGRAMNLARKYGASLNIVSSVEQTPWWTDKLLSGLATRWQTKITEETNHKLEQMTESARAEGLRVTCKTLIGRAWLELIHEVLKNGHDLVVKDVDSSDAFEGLFSPDMDLHVLRKCPCPVWLVKRKVTQFRRIAAAIDIVPDDDGRNDFNAKILDLASSLAKMEGSELHVVRSWSIYGESVLKSHMSEEELEQIKSEKRQALQTKVNEFVEPYREGIGVVHVHLPEGAAEDVIPTVVEREHEDLLVMGTIARTGVAGLIIGNTAEKILRKINCSVLAVKPDDYVSPVAAQA